MHPNNCVTRKLSHISTQTHQYGLVMCYAYACSHICLRSQQLKQLPKLFELFVKNNSKTRLCLTVNSFLKSRLFANINVFKLFDLPKSRL